MRMILWAVIFFMAYIYMTTSDKDQFFLEKGRAIYEMIVNWFEDAELDFHLKKENEKKPKRGWR